MPGKDPGAELTSVGDELRSQEAVSELERAATALEGLTAAVETLQKSFASTGQGDAQTPPTDTQPPTASALQSAAAASTGNQDPVQGGQTTTVEKAGGAAAAALREVSERAMSLAKALDEAETIDTSKLGMEVEALVKVLVGIVEKYPSPEAAQKNAQGAAQIVKADVDIPTELQAASDKALSMASAISNAGETSENNVAEIDEILGKIGAIGSVVGLEKSNSDPKLPDVFSQENVEKSALAEGMAKVLRDVAERTSTLCKLAKGQESMSAAGKEELATLQAILIKAKDSIPTKVTKAAYNVQARLREIAGRALNLSEKADKRGMKDTKQFKELATIKAIIDELEKKCKTVKKGAIIDVTDFDQVLTAEKFIEAFTSELAKLEEDEVKAAAATQNKEEDARVQSLLSQINALTGQVSELQATVAKARGKVQTPATVTEPTQEQVAKNADILFPMDYNDEAYRAELKKRGLEE